MAASAQDQQGGGNYGGGTGSSDSNAGGFAGWGGWGGSSGSNPFSTGVQHVMNFAQKAQNTLDNLGLSNFFNFQKPQSAAEVAAPTPPQTVPPTPTGNAAPKSPFYSSMIDAANGMGFGPHAAITQQGGQFSQAPSDNMAGWGNVRTGMTARARAAQGPQDEAYNSQPDRVVQPTPESTTIPNQGAGIPWKTPQTADQFAAAGAGIPHVDQSSAADPTSPLEASADPNDKMANLVGSGMETSGMSPSGAYHTMVSSRYKDGSIHYAMGRYGIMNENVRDWSKEMGIPQPSTADFLNNKDNIQDKMFHFKFGQYVKQFGLAGAAARWIGFGKDKFGTTTDSYVKKFMGLAQKAGLTNDNPASKVTGPPKNPYRGPEFKDKIPRSPGNILSEGEIKKMLQNGGARLAPNATAPWANDPNKMMTLAGYDDQGNSIYVPYTGD